MKWALLTTQMVFPVADEEEAGSLAMQAEVAARQNIAAQVEQADASVAALTETGFRFLGTAVSVWDDEPSVVIDDPALG